MRPQTHSWIIIPDSTGRRCYCYRSPDDLQYVRRLAVASGTTPFHDAQLARATKEINAILERVEKMNKDPKRNLAILNTPRGLFLAWTSYGAIGATDSEGSVRKALGLR